jgi:hypothetical protein
LDVGLGIDDLPWLESIANDRAESVRVVASALIAGVPATPAFTARLAEAARCFVRSGLSVAGILSRIGLASASAVAFKPPSSAAGTERSAMLANLFAGFSVAEIAAAAGLTAAEVIAAIPEDEEAVYAAFSSRSARDGDNATMERLVEARLAAADTRTHPAHILAWLADHLIAPVSDEFGNALLCSAALQAALRRFREAETPGSSKDDGTFVWTAAVLPAGLLGSFVAMIAPLPPATTRNARDFADLVVVLDTEPTQHTPTQQG